MSSNKNERPDGSRPYTLRRRLLTALLSITLLALAVSCAVTAAGLRRISVQTLEAANAGSDAILTEVRNAFYQSDIGIRLSAAYLGAKTLTAAGGDPEALLDAALSRMRDVDMLFDDVVFLAQDGELLAVRAVFPDNIGSYDVACAEAVLAQTIDADPASYGIETEQGETYTGILDYFARTGGGVAYSTEYGVMLVAQTGENGMQLGVLTPDTPASIEIRILQETAEQFRSEAQETVAKTRLELVLTLAVIWLCMAVGIIFIARRATAALAEPLEREQLEREYALQKAEDEKRALSEVDRLKTEFLGNISHELKTPLTVMSGYAQDSRALLRGGADEADRDAIEHNMRIITAETDRLALMVSQLLDITSIDERHVRLHLESVSPTQLVSDTLNTYYPMFSGQGNTVSFKREDSVPTLSCDAQRIRQVLVNLLSNATRHTRNGNITVTLSWDADSAVFSVADDGEGIAAAELPYIFERYERSAAKAGDGRNTGAGTTIRFTIPLRSGSSETDTSSPA